MKIFVPGRICLFGEHSDWAGGYRRINSDIEKGHALIVGTNQGIYAEVVGLVYQTKYGADIVDDIVNNIPDDDEWDIVDPFTYSSGSIMGVMTNHAHPVDPRHVREFVDYIQAARGGTWRAQEI